MKIDKKISVGNILTLFAILGSFVWSESLLISDTKTALKSSDIALKTSQENRIRIAVVETKIDDGFEHLGKLIKELQK